MAKKSRPLVEMDMTDRRHYKPPPLPARDPDAVFKIDLSGIVENSYLRFAIRQGIYKKMIVEFSIELQWSEGSVGPWFAVCRVDTAHGTIHMHQFKKIGEAETRTEIYDIPLETGWNFVNSHYQEIYDCLLDGLETIMSRWRQ